MACTYLCGTINLNGFAYSFCSNQSNHISLNIFGYNQLLGDFCAAPLDPNPFTDFDKIVNELRLQCRTIGIKFHVRDVSMLQCRFFFCVGLESMW